MPNMSELNFEKFEADLKKLLNKMSKKQLGQFLTVLSARNIIYFSDDSFEHKDILRYLNKLFISLSYNCAIFFSGHTSDRDLILDLDPPSSPRLLLSEQLKV